jgi:hypothetical protein
LGGEASDPDEFGHLSIFALCSPFVKHDSVVPFAPRNVFTIKEFQQRNGILSGDPRPGFEVGYREFRPGSRDQNPPESIESGGVKNQFLVYFNEFTVSKQDLEQRTGAASLDAGAGEHVGGGRHGQASLAEQFSILRVASDSSVLSEIRCEASRTISPSTTMSGQSRKSSSSRKGGEAGSAALRNSSFAIPDKRGLIA